MRYALIVALGTMLMTNVAFPRQPLASAQPNVPPDVVASRAAVQKFSATLSDALQQAIQNGGPVNGITVCHDKAAQIATDLSQELGIVMGRTSLKVRNSSNAPDTWEIAVLKQFEARKAQGEPVDKLEFFAVITDDKDQKTFRYMKAIPTAPLCLSCHGEKLDSAVDAKLKELYPNDQAHGFKEGSLRGAFTIAKPLP